MFGSMSIKRTSSLFDYVFAGDIYKCKLIQERCIDDINTRISNIAQDRDFPNWEPTPDKIPNRTKYNDPLIYTGVTFLEY